MSRTGTISALQPYTDKVNYGGVEMDRTTFSKINLTSAFVDLRRALDKEPTHGTANALALIGEDLRNLHGVDLRPYFDREELPDD